MTEETSQLSNPTWVCAQQWWKAVDTAGLGFYESATEQLASVMSDCRDLPACDGHPLAALCLSTQESWERQLGNHYDAAVLDDKALKLLRQDIPEVPADRDPTTVRYVWLMALADATSGRAADYLGVGDVEAARKVVDEGDDVLVALRDLEFPEELDIALGEDPSDAMWGHCGMNATRVVIRHAWVSTEVAIGEGRWDHAQNCSQQGAELSGEWFSPRHYVKSLVVDAAAWAGTDAATATHKATRAYEEAKEAGFLPLQWAAVMLLRDLSGHDTATWDEERVSCEEELVHRGAYFAS